MYIWPFWGESVVALHPDIILMAAFEREANSQQVGACKTSGRLGKRTCACESYSDVRDALRQSQATDYL